MANTQLDGLVRNNSFKKLLCKECGCKCSSCSSLTSLDLHQQIEELRSQLSSSHAHITQIELDIVSEQKAAAAEVNKLHEDLYKLRDRYDRLFDSHKNLQRLNNSLEDKMLDLVNKFEGEKLNLQQELASVSAKLTDAKLTICDLEYENQRNQEDCNMAVQLLQCKPSNFVAHRLSTLPYELQERIKSYNGRHRLKELNSSRGAERKVIRVPMSTFPPTAMMYSVDGDERDATESTTTAPGDATVPMTIIAKVLKPSEPTRRLRRTYVCSKCNDDVVLVDASVQTDPSDTHSYFRRIRLDSTETDI